MKCPLDQNTLVISERSGIEIDYCPECRGVWLDRGELDKLIDRAGSASSGIGSGVGAGLGAGLGHAPAPSAGSPDQSRYEREHAEWQRDHGLREAAAQAQQPVGYDHQPVGYDQRRAGYGPGGQRRKKKDNWLSELFD